VAGVFIVESGSNYLSGDLLVYNDKNKSGFLAEFTVDYESGSVRSLHDHINYKRGKKQQLTRQI
jgi:hypothetical protein